MTGERAEPEGDAAPERRSAAPPTADLGVARPSTDRRTLDEVFGDVLPDVTRDELDDSSDRRSGDAEVERWYRENRPPHHG